MGKRIIVTGGAGFLGRHVCDLADSRGDDVISLDLQKRDEPYIHLQGSVTDDTLWDGLPSADVVVHGAALTNLWHKDPSAFEEVNVGGTAKALKYAERVGARFIYISSYTASLPRKASRPFTVSHRTVIDRTALAGRYPRSKWDAERLCEASPVPTTILRPTAPIGPGDYGPTPPMGLVRDLVSGELPGIMAGSINVVDVRDLAQAVFSAVHRGEEGHAYLLSGYDLPLKSFAKMIAMEARVKAPGLVVPPFVARLAARFDGLKSALTGSPVTAPLDGVRLASLPVTFDASAAQTDLLFDPRPLEMTINDAVEFARQELLLG